MDERGLAATQAHWNAEEPACSMHRCTIARNGATRKICVAEIPGAGVSSGLGGSAGLAGSDAPTQPAGVERMLLRILLTLITQAFICSNAIGSQVDRC